MTWSLVQKSASLATATGTSLPVPLPGASTAGNLLSIKLISSQGTATWTLPAGWQQAESVQNGGVSHSEIWYYPNNPGGITSVTCTSSLSANVKGSISEYFTDVTTPVVTLLTGGSGLAGTSKTCAVTSDASALAGDLVECCFDEHFGAATAITWTNPAGFTLTASDTASGGNHHYSGYQLAASSGAQTVTGTSSVAGDNTHSWAGVIAVFHAAPSSATGPAGHVGAYLNPSFFGTGVTQQQAIGDWITWTARPLTVRRIYYPLNATIPPGPTSDMLADGAAGRRIAISFRPAYNPVSDTDAAHLDTFLSACFSAGLDMVVSLWQEPYGSSQPGGANPGMTKAQEIAAWQFYAPTIRQYYPTCFNTSSYSQIHNGEASWYPGDAYIDQWASDFYCSEYNGGITVQQLMAPADAATPPKPFGLWEINSGTGQTNSQATQYFAHLKSSMSARIAAGKRNADVLLYNSSGSGSSQSNPITASNDFRIPLLDALFDAIDGVTSATSPQITTTSLPDATNGNAYSQTLAVSGGTSPYTWSVSVGSLPSGLSLSSGGVLSGTPSVSGLFSFTVLVTDAVSNTDTQAFVLTVDASTAVSITTTSLPVAEAGSAYSTTLAATNGTSPYTWAVTSSGLPTGLSLNASTGVISGTPQSQNSQSVTFQVTDALGGTATATLALTVAATLNISTTTLPNGGLSSPYSQALATTGGTGTLTWSVISGSLPGGLTLGSSTGVISGTPTAAGTFSFTVRAADTYTNDPQALTLVIQALAVGTGLPGGTVLQAYSQTLTVTGGTGPYTWALTSGTLPPGLSLSSGGVISGTPAQVGSFSFTVTATDSLSATGVAAESISIAAPVIPVSLAGILPGNILTGPDSDFESGIGGWTAVANASSLSTTTNWAYTGTSSLVWTVTSVGDSSVGTGFYPVTAKLPYVASAVMNPGASHPCSVRIDWYNGGSFLSSTTGAVQTAPGGSVGWPVSAAGKAPGTATQAKIVVTVSGGSGGGHQHVDLVYFAQSRVQILTDWLNPAFAPGSAAGSAFADITPWVRLDASMTWSRGRQDAVSNISSGSASFSVHNDPGWFTSGNSSSPWFPNVKLGRRTQINVADETGTWYTRFDGPISEIDYTFTETGLSNTATVSLADALAYLSRQSELSCWTKETVLADGPALHWTLDDPAGSKWAAESSGSNGAPLRLRRFGSGQFAATIQFGGGNGGVETQANAPDTSSLGNPSTSPLSSVYMSPFIFDNSDENIGIHSSSAQLSSQIPPMSTRTGSNWSVEFWATLDQASGYSGAGSLTAQFTLGLLALTDTRTGKNFDFGMDSGISSPSDISFPPDWFLATFVTPVGISVNQPVSPATIATPVDIPVNDVGGLPDAGVPIHFVANVTGNDSGGSLTVYMNGAVLGTIALPAFFTPDWIDLGGLSGGYGGWLGNISLVSVYDYKLSTAQISAHAAMGSTAMAQQGTHQCIQKIAAFAGLPSFWSHVSASYGLSQADYIDLTGTSALSIMQQYEAAELDGLLYTDALGRLRFDGRQVRAAAGPPSLVLPEGSYDSSLGFKITDQDLVTDASVGTPATARSVTVTNPAAAADYGAYPAGTPGSPSSLPLLSLSPEFPLRGAEGHEAQFDPYVTDAAAWLSYRRSTPHFWAPTISVEAITMQDPAAHEYVALSALYGLDINSTLGLAGEVAAFPADISSASPGWVSDAANISSCYSLDPVATTRIFNQATAFISGGSATTDPRPAGFGNATPILNYTAYAQFKADVTNATYVQNSVTYTPAGPINAVFGWVRYDNESWVQTPAEESADPQTYLQNFITLAHAHGLKVMVTPARDLASTDTAHPKIGSEPFDQWYLRTNIPAACAGADILEIQDQANQADPSGEFSLFFGEARALARAASPGISVWCGISTTYGTGAGMYTAAQAVSPADGFWINIVSDPTDSVAFMRLVLGSPLPTAPGYFVEGITETMSDQSHIVQFFSSPASLSRCWIPGHATFGVLDSTAVIGVSDKMSGPSGPRAKQNVTDPGPPFLPPSYAAGMNGGANGFVGATDQRGIWQAMQTVQKPPLCIVGQSVNNQTLSSGTAGTEATIQWDTVYVDSTGGMGAVPGSPNYWICTVPGFYELDAVVIFSASAGGNRFARFLINQDGGAANGPAGSNAMSYGATSRRANGSQPTPVNISTRVYLGVGATVGVHAWQDSGSVLGTGTGTANGSIMSIRFTGYSTAAD